MTKLLAASTLAALALSAALASPGFAQGAAAGTIAGAGACDLPANVVNALQGTLATVVQAQDGNGGLFRPNRMWSAVVDRAGRLCSVTVTGDAWPGSRAIAIAKASTANGFSNSALALSTANLYGPTQPNGSLYGLNNSNPFNPVFDAQNFGVGFVPGGIITFGGGVALYANGQVIGGLGVSGDTSCADHAIAYRMRKLAGLNGIPAGVGPNNTDNIIYAAGPTVNPANFEQPHCTATDLAPQQIEAFPPAG